MFKYHDCADPRDAFRLTSLDLAAKLRGIRPPPNTSVVLTMHSDVKNLEAHCAVLELIAAGFAEGSKERAAIHAAAQALNFVRHEETRAKFQAWVDSWTEPPTALQVLNAKLAGIDDLPHELLDDTLREVEQLMEKLRQRRA